MKQNSFQLTPDFEISLRRLKLNGVATFERLVVCCILKFTFLLKGSNYALDELNVEIRVPKRSKNSVGSSIGVAFPSLRTTFILAGAAIASMRGEQAWA